MISKKGKIKKKSKFKSILKEVKISQEILKPKRRKWTDSTSSKEKTKEEKQAENNKDNTKNNRESKASESLKEDSFHETIINEDIGFPAPVLNPQNQPQSNQTGFDSLESTAAEFISPNINQTKTEDTINYAGRTMAGNYAGASNYLSNSEQRYSSDGGANFLGMQNESQGVSFNPFSEARVKSHDSSWGSNKSELEDFARQQEKEHERQKEQDGLPVKQEHKKRELF
jgi:hypothetical protein